MITGKGAAYFDYMEKQGKPVVYETESVPVPVYAPGDEETPQYYEVYGSIGDLLYDNLSRDFFGIAYKKTMKSEGDGVTVSYRYASFENGINVRSAAYVASAAYKDTSDEEDIELLEGFIGKAFCQKAGMTKKRQMRRWRRAAPNGRQSFRNLPSNCTWVAERSSPRKAFISMQLSTWVRRPGRRKRRGCFSGFDRRRQGAESGRNPDHRQSRRQNRLLRGEVLEREPDAPYIVTVKGGTADKTKPPGDTVNLTVDKTAIPEGNSSAIGRWTAYA